jgi:hypothetical protein
VHAWLDRSGETLVVRYEDLRADPDTVLGDVVAFLGVDADPARVEYVVRSNTFDRMREKERRTMEGHEQGNSKHFFVNRGIVGASLQAFGDEDFGLIESLAGSALHRLGYEVRPAGVAARRA